MSEECVNCHGVGLSQSTPPRVCELCKGRGTIEVEELEVLLGQPEELLNDKFEELEIKQGPSYTFTPNYKPKPWYKRILRK